MRRATGCAAAARLAIAPSAWRAPDSDRGADGRHRQAFTQRAHNLIQVNRIMRKLAFLSSRVFGAAVLLVALLLAAPRLAAAQDAAAFINNLGTQGLQVLG